jgi:hypothetical protein
LTGTAIAEGAAATGGAFAALARFSFLEALLSSAIARKDAGRSRISMSVTILFMGNLIIRGLGREGGAV